jgi:hypothetical protein
VLPLLPLLVMACSNESTSKSVANAAAATPSPAVEMPPPIAETHTYRCDDESTLTVDFLADGTTLLLRRKGATRPITLTAPARGLDFVGDNIGITVAGRSIVLTEKNERTRTCVRA